MSDKKQENDPRSKNKRKRDRKKQNQAADRRKKRLDTTGIQQETPNKNKNFDS